MSPHSAASYTAQAGVLSVVEPLALIALCLSAPASSPRVVRGVALERGTRRPLPGAQVTIDGAIAGESDPDGRFAVPVIPGPHALGVSLPGFVPLYRAIAVGE